MEAAADFGQRRALDGSGSGGSRSGQFPALRNAAAAGADFRRQGKQGQHRARGVAGAAIRNSDRHFRDGRARPAGAASGIREPAGQCVHRASRSRSTWPYRRRGKTQAEVELSAEGRSLGTTQVTLNAGVNPIRMQARLETAGRAGSLDRGAHQRRGRIAGGSGGDVAPSQGAVCFGRSRRTSTTRCPEL